jgi:hypothetical protein
VKFGTVDLHVLPFTIHELRENRCSENRTWSRKLNLAHIFCLVASDLGPPRAGVGFDKKKKKELGEEGSSGGPAESLYTKSESLTELQSDLGWGERVDLYSP